MPSQALQEWRTTRRAELDRLDAAVRSVHASDRAYRQQLVDMHTLLLAGQFQLFCRSLHDEAVGIAVGHVQPVSARKIVYALLTGRQQLDRGNAHPAALDADFRMLGVDLWPELPRDRRLQRRRRRLEQLNVWRNAIAHQALPLGSGNAVRAAGTGRTLRWARLWRSNCSVLAQQMDRIVKLRLTTLFGTRPW